jgi:hypothetical protein
MPRLFLAFIALSFASSASGASSNCDAVLAQIDAKVRAAGVSRFTLTTVDADAPVNDKVVGTCDLGTKKIIYAKSDPQAAPPQPRSEPVLTECKDGSVSVGGDCRK